MSDEQRRDRDADPFREGIRTVSGILGALKDAIEETFDELRESGDLSPEGARDAARSAVRRAQEQFDDMRDRLDFVPRREFDELRARVDALEARLARQPAGGEGASAAGMGSGAGPANPGGTTGEGPANPGGAAGATGDGTAGSGRGFPVDEG